MNYIGSKLSLMSFLQTTIKTVTGITDGNGYVFADLFAGTGVVGSRFKENGWKVISNDIQYYSYVLNRHFIQNNPPINTSFVDYLDDLDGIDGFIYKNYCFGSGSERNYYTDYNGKKCDAIRTELERLRSNKQITEDEYFYYLASLINSIDKCANTASVYGAFLKHTKKSALQNFSFKLLPVIKGNSEGVVYNSDINKLIRKLSGDVLYLDPPYNTRQYCTNYHVLETIARYDNPILKGKTGLRNYDEQKSSFCSKRTVAASFENVIKHADFEFIFLSYNNEGLMPLDLIREIMSEYGQYIVFTKDYHRFRADKNESRNHKSSQTIEYLHCLIKN